MFCFSNPIGTVTIGKYMRRLLDGQRKNTGMLKGILGTKIIFFSLINLLLIHSTPLIRRHQQSLVHYVLRYSCNWFFPWAPSGFFFPLIFLWNWRKRRVSFRFPMTIFYHPKAAKVIHSYRILILCFPLFHLHSKGALSVFFETRMFSVGCSSSN